MQIFRIFLGLLIWFGCISPLSAQVKVYIEDETGEGFYLGLNRYLQHPEKQTHLLLTGLDTVPYSLQLEQDTFNFQRKLHLRKAGSHFYVLRKNFYGQLKLRYRGMGEPAGDYAAVEYHRDVAWPEDWQPKGKRSRLDYWTRASEKQRAEQQAALERSKQVEADSLKIVVEVENDTSGVLAAGNDTVVKNAIVIEETEPEMDSFDQFMSRMQNTDFEFEKLKLAKEFSAQQKLSIAEMRSILRALQYDHSKLDFLSAARSFALNPHKLLELKAELGYVISQNKFEKMMAE